MIPEDHEPSYACEKCEGGRITENEEWPGTWDWGCKPKPSKIPMGK